MNTPKEIRARNIKLGNLEKESQTIDSFLKKIIKCATPSEANKFFWWLVNNSKDSITREDDHPVYLKIMKMLCKVHPNCTKSTCKGFRKEKM